MSIKLSGLNSGMDTESIIQELVKAKSDKKIKLEGEQKKLEWKQEAWKDLNSKIYGLYSKTLSNMRLVSDYTKKVTKASSNAVSVVTGANTPNGVQKLKINQMATAGYLTGAKLAEKSGTYKSTSNVKQILGTTEDVSFYIESGDKKKEIKITDSTTIQDVLTTMREAGVNANFDEVNQRFYISAKSSGDANDFSITADNTKGMAAMAKLGLMDEKQSAEIHKYADALKYDDKGVVDDAASLTNMKSLIDAEIEKRKEERKTAITDAQEKIAELTSERDKLDPADTEAIAKIDEQIEKQNAIISEAEAYYSEEQVGKDLLALAKDYAPIAKNAAAVKIDGQDSEIELNGVIYKSDKNTFEINDMTITVNAKTDEEITLTTADDTEGIYDMVKNFFKEYNELINEMDKLYNADSARKYDMLTDEEREAISEEEAEEWDEKIKSSLLRRDSQLGTVFDSMKMIMLEGVTMSDGSKMYLSDFGINTMGYFGAKENERNAYHIDGDKDDESTSNNTDKLRAAIAADSAVVAEFFSGLTRNLYERLDTLMARTDLSSAFTVYNDKSLKEEYENYKEKIADQEEKIADFEDRYYDQFTQMEKAMAKLNSQQSALSSLFA